MKQCGAKGCQLTANWQPVLYVPLREKRKGPPLTPMQRALQLQRDDEPKLLFIEIMLPIVVCKAHQLPTRGWDGLKELKERFTPRRDRTYVWDLAWIVNKYFIEY